MSEPITNVEDAVRELGALPVPIGDVPQPMSPERLAEIREHVAGIRNWSLGNLAARDLLAEVDRLRDERHKTNESLSDAAEALRENAARIAELEALTPAAIQTCRVCGAGYSYGEPCQTCEFKARMAAELQARGLEDPHDSPLHHAYKTPRDLPELGGLR